MRDLPFTEYELEIKWITKDGRQRGKPFTWKASDKETHQIDSVIPLSVIEEARSFFGSQYGFDVPRDTVFYTLKAIVDKKEYALVKNVPVNRYTYNDQDTSISATSPIALFTLPPAPPAKAEKK